MRARELYRDIAYAVGNIICLILFFSIVLLCTPFVFIFGGIVMVYDAWAGACGTVADMFPGTFKKGWLR